MVTERKKSIKCERLAHCLQNLEIYSRSIILLKLRLNFHIFRTDVVTYADETKQIILYYYSRERRRFEEKKRFYVMQNTKSKDFRKYSLVDVAVADFDNNGNVDILCVLSVSHSAKYLLKFFFQQKSTFSGDENHRGGIMAVRHLPMVIQLYDPDIRSLRTHVIIQETFKERRLIHFENHNTSPKPALISRNFTDFLVPANSSYADKCMDFKKVKWNRMSKENAGAFIDLNTDCRADLVVETIGTRGTRCHEIYLFTDEGFCLVDVNTVPWGFSNAIFFDVSGDGSNDLVFVNRNLVLYIYLNANWLGVSHRFKNQAKRINLCEVQKFSLEKPFVSYKSKKNSSVSKRIKTELFSLFTSNSLN